METRVLAGDAVRKARDTVAQLAQRALGSQAFRDAAWCAELAGELSRLLGGVTPDAPPTSSPPPDDARGTEAVSARHAAPDRPSRRAKASDKYKGAAGKYPIFYRDGDTLVKVGWSKSQNGEYEHRAPRRAAEALVKAVAAGGHGQLFGMDAVLPLSDAAGEDLPSYQVYLALAWLRDQNAVTRHGRDGYALDPTYKDATKIQELWDKLPKKRP